MPSQDNPMFITNLYDWLIALQHTEIPRTKHFTVDEVIHTYMRIGRYMIEGSISQAVTIASVDSDKPGEGHFKQFITTLEEFCRTNLPHHSIVVENVLNPDLLAQLQKHGYQLYDIHWDGHGDIVVAHAHKKP